MVAWCQGYGDRKVEVMKILFSPQFADDRLLYEIINDIIHVEYVERELQRESELDEGEWIVINRISDTFDFTGLPDGELIMEDLETGEELVTTDLPFNPINRAFKKDGVLHVELMNFLDRHETDESKLFPDWVDSENIPRGSIESGMI